MENHAYALVKALKFFSIYVLQSKIIVYVPDIAVKEILVQPDSEDKRGRWIAKIMEYDVDIKKITLLSYKIWMVMKMQSHSMGGF